MTGLRALAGHRLPGQVARFGVVGVAATVTHYLTAAAAAVAINAYAANLAGYLAAVGISYHGHKHWTFRARRPRTSRTGQFPRFVVVSVSALGLSELVLHLGLHTLALPRAWALLLAVLAVPPVTFVTTRFWVFRNGKVNTS